MTRLVILTFVIFTSGVISASTWYVSSTGTSTNGTVADPWGVEYSFTNSLISPGDEILFTPGTYTCTNWSDSYSATNVVLFSRSGNGAAKVTYRPTTLWGFTFEGGVIVPSSSSNLIIRDFIVTCPWITPRYRTNQYHYPGGINIYGSNVMVMHNVFDNTGHPSIGQWNYTGELYIAGNICRFPGYWDSAESGSGTVGQRGSGGYYQTMYTGGNHIVSGNITYYLPRNGQKVTGANSAFTFTGNMIYESLQFGLDYYSKEDQPDAVTYSSNYVFSPTVGVAAYLGTDTTPDMNYTVAKRGYITNNYFVGSLKGLVLTDHWTNVTVTGNTIMNMGSFGDGQSGFVSEYNVMAIDSTAPIQTPTYVMSGNAYYTDASTTYDFIYAGTNVSFAALMSIVGDSTSTYSIGYPTSNAVYVVRPSTDTTFAHVAVYNWQTNSSQVVDLTGVFAGGDSIDIYDAQNIPTAYTNVIFGGTSITLDLSLTNYVPMIGVYTNVANAWAGFDPRFRAFVLHKTQTQRSFGGKSTWLGKGNFK